MQCQLYIITILSTSKIIGQRILFDVNERNLKHLPILQRVTNNTHREKVHTFSIINGCISNDDVEEASLITLIVRIDSY